MPHALRASDAAPDGGGPACVLAGRRVRDGWHYSLAHPGAAGHARRLSAATTLGELLDGLLAPSAPADGRR